MTSSSVKSLTSLEEKVLAFVREHGAESQGALVPRTPALCTEKFNATPLEVLDALTSLEARRLVSCKRPEENYVSSRPVLTAKERAEKHRAKQTALGRKQMMLWVTPEEEAALKEVLDGMRRTKAH